MWFPLVGLALGAALSAAHFLLGQLFSPLLAAALTVALWAALTGGLHLDGLADCCDGLLASTTRERRLEIMRDPRLGAYGDIGLFIFLILKILAISSIHHLPPSGSSSFILHPLLLAPPLARWLILLVATQPSARPGGMGADFALGLKPAVFIVAAIIPLALIALGGARAIAAAVAAHALALGIIALARNQIGGVTGDVFGLTIEAGELATLLVFAAA